MMHLDGNTLAGPLAEIFSVDMTTASARCLGCGATAMLAAAMVYQDAMGWVARCAGCDSVLATVVEGPESTWVSLSGVSALEVPRPA